MIGPIPWKCWYVDTHVRAPCDVFGNNKHPPTARARHARLPPPLARFAPSSPRATPLCCTLHTRPIAPRSTTTARQVPAYDAPQRTVMEWAAVTSLMASLFGGGLLTYPYAYGIVGLYGGVVLQVSVCARARYNTSGGTRPVEQLTTHLLCSPLPAVLPWPRSPGRAVG
jgi:hypothetical protein